MLVSCAVAQSNDSDSTFRAQPTYGMMFTFAVLSVDSSNCSIKNFHVDVDAKCYGSLSLALYAQPGTELPHATDTVVVKIPHHFTLPNKTLYTFSGVQQIAGTSTCTFVSAQLRYYGVLPAAYAQRLPLNFTGYKNSDGSFRVPPEYVVYDFKNK
jgi:hypothetical protein